MIKFQDTFGKSTTERKIKWEQELENKKYTNGKDFAAEKIADKEITNFINSVFQLN
jgi:hypothetical protein